MQVVLASSNPHKIEEISANWSQVRRDTNPIEIELVGLDSLEQKLAEPVENQDTYEGNAILKARHYARHSRRCCLADDSGLEVDALNGRPGVHSARYSQATGPRPQVDAANNRKLMKELGDTPALHRTARFVCAMALVEPADEIGGGESVLAVVRGTIEGRILTLEEADTDMLGRGKNGFGYDPLFLVPHLGQTTAELSATMKNAISHRGEAARQMWVEIVELFERHGAKDR